MKTELKSDMSITLAMTLTEAQARALTELAKFDHGRIALALEDQGFIPRGRKEHVASFLGEVQSSLTPLIRRVDDARAVFDGRMVAGTPPRAESV
ncbi:hypothetical protein [Asticcacaulis excentricus]|uniref:Uncharacterized protein n=1 Tax=Asticcacaulis excentricus (strain ATCC 15261 / DSM 4724 / KCTC 12464 / NCIMB 9791 / VKM B-1370 / CB 48) TaxID=573065 RepID=E8RPM8_ASTEC|nr:hypothetical protein [Asticcacaulis excentricus]ADU12005.1 hypothetical protein Astex_0307 [Asticcacaulis excentricus CB 48]